MVKIITLKENIAEHENSLKCERKQPSIRVRQRYGKRKKNSGIIFDYRNLKKDISPKKKE